MSDHTDDQLASWPEMRLVPQWINPAELAHTATDAFYEAGEEILEMRLYSVSIGENGGGVLGCVTRTTPRGPAIETFAVSTRGYQWWAVGDHIAEVLVRPGDTNAE